MKLSIKPEDYPRTPDGKVDYFELGLMTSAEVRAAQGLPPHVTDPLIYDRVAKIIVNTPWWREQQGGVA